MRRDEILKVKVVQAESAEEFERKLNVVLKNVLKPQITWNHNMGHCAYVTYVETVETLEDVSDIFHRDGVYYHCRNCPFFDLPNDKRFKRGACRISPSGVAWKDSEACTFLYKQLLSGELTVDDLKL